MHSNAPYISANVERFMGFAEHYDTFRPQPPVMLVNILTQLAGVPHPALVVDLGSGTGLSTMLWTGRAARVLGIEPSTDMRQQAEIRAAQSANTASIEFRAGYSHATGLPDACADIVTCSQALHWMEPATAFAEIVRILRPGGIFAAYDCDWPPTFNLAVEHAYNDCLSQATIIEQTRGLSRDVQYWDKRQHLERMRASGHFRFVRELVVHHTEQGNAARLVGLALSQGQVAALLKAGVSEDEIGITGLRAVATHVLGDTNIPWFWSYRVRLGMR